MSPRNDLHRVKLGKTTLDVPIHKDTHTTENIANNITKQLIQIEEQSTRIDTQAFALLTAYHYAVELEKAHAEQKKDTTDLVKALDTLNTKLRNMLKEFDGESE